MNKGYVATSIDDVARKLGSTKGRIYHHYSSKSELFADVFRTGMELNFATIDPLRSTGEPAIVRWKKMSLAHVRAMIDLRAFQRVVAEGAAMHLRGSTTPEQREALLELIEARARYTQIFRDIIEEARNDGDMDFKNAGIAVQMMFAALNSPVYWYEKREDQPDEEIDNLAREIVEFALRGLGGKVE